VPPAGAPIAIINAPTSASVLRAVFRYEFIKETP
jgi:hypothetical protein